MLELRPDPYAKPSRFANHRQRLAVFARRGTATPGCATAVSGNIATSTEPEESLSSRPPAAVRKLRRKRLEISTYESIRLKLHLESTLTEKMRGGSLGTSLRVAARDRSTLLESYSCKSTSATPMESYSCKKYRGVGSHL